MTRYIWTFSAAALLTGCVPSVNPEQFGRAYGEQVGVEIGVPQSAAAEAGAGFDALPGSEPVGEPEAVNEAPVGVLGAEAPRFGLTNEEIAYLTVLFASAGLEFDPDGTIPADNDGDGVANIVDDDVDGDGIPNGEDDDIDGDGEPNRDDQDIDGDGISNDDDPDIDGDGEPNDEDADADGDGLSDRWDLNDDGDGEPDDEDEDNEGDEPSDTLEDLVARLQGGLVTDGDRDKIAHEIADRLNSPAQEATLRGLIDELELQAVSPNRGVSPSDAPPAINAIDELYLQLGDAIDQARRSQPNPRGPLSNTRMTAALNDFIDRGQAMKRLGAIFPTVPLGVASEQVADLRTAFAGDRLTEIATRMGEHVNPDARGSEAEERRELEQIGKGAASLGRAFRDDEPEDILDGVDRLRALADRLEDEDEREAFYGDLLERVSEVSEESSGSSLDDVLTQVEQENEVEEDQP